MLGLARNTSAAPPSRWWRKLRRAPGDAEYAELLGESLLAALDPEAGVDAETLLAKWVAADSDALVAYLALAALYRQRGEIGRSIHLHQNLLLRRDLDESLRLRALLGLAQDYRSGGFLQRAASAFEEVLVHRPRQIRALEALVELCSGLGEYDRALALHRRLERARKQRDPKREAELLVGAAEQACEEGDSERARRSVKRALRRDPNHWNGGVLLGRLEAEKGRDKAALKVWRSVLTRRSTKSEPRSTGDSDLDLFAMVEASFAALHRARDYEGFLRELSVIRPSDDRVALALSRHLAARGDMNASLLVLRNFVDQFPERLSARVALTRALLDQGRSEDALGEASELLTRLGECSALLERESVE